MGCVRFSIVCRFVVLIPEGHFQQLPGRSRGSSPVVGYRRAVKLGAILLVHLELFHCCSLTDSQSITVAENSSHAFV